MNDVKDTIENRNASYGSYADQSKIAFDLIDRMGETPKWKHMSPDKRQSLIMIQIKIARLLNGDPNHTDSWHDIAGYAKLAEDGTVTIRTCCGTVNGQPHTPMCNAH